MASIWQVTWNKNLYDYKRVIIDYKNGRHTGFIKISKGMAKMRVEPQIGDEVYISCDKLKIMKCKIVSGFVDNQQEMRDHYHIVSSDLLNHTRNNIFLMVIHFYFLIKYLLILQPFLFFLSLLILFFYYQLENYLD